LSHNPIVEHDASRARQHGTKLFYATSKHFVPSLYQIGETTVTHTLVALACAGSKQ
jgi:hypothetical protein